MGRGEGYFTGFYHSFAKACEIWVWLGLLTFERVAAHSSGGDGGRPGLAFAEWRWLTFSLAWAFRRGGMKFSTTPSCEL